MDRLRRKQFTPSQSNFQRQSNPQGYQPQSQRNFNNQQ